MLDTMLISTVWTEHTFSSLQADLLRGLTIGALLILLLRHLKPVGTLKAALVEL